MLCGGGRDSGLAASGEPAQKVSCSRSQELGLLPSSPGPEEMVVHMFSGARELGEAHSPLRAQQREGFSRPELRGKSCPGGRCWGVGVGA